MIAFKEEIAGQIANIVNLPKVEIEEFVELPKDSSMGDYAFPCFRLAKVMKKAPQVIAEEIKRSLEENQNEIIEKIEVVNGYLNFFVKKEVLAREVIKEIMEKQENYGSSNIGEGKNIIVEYSSPNIAKPFHIGHLRSTVIGNALYHIYQFLGYHVTGINHLGDWGTQFGKMIEGYKRWGAEYSLEENAIDKLTEIYVRINELCKQDEEVLEACRENFKKLEKQDPYCVEIWQKLRDLSLQEFQRIYDLLDIHFDSTNGEAFYSDKMPEVMELLEKSGKLLKSEGAQIVSLEEQGMAPCMIEKSNGSTTYATRDLAAILYRTRTYHFDKCIYVVAYEQNLHFKQIFEVAKLLGIEEKYSKGLTHVPFGMVRLKTGKMSTREGTVIKLDDLLQEAVQRAKEIIEEKNPELDDKEETAKKVGIGAVIFNDLANNRIKDEVFDLEEMLNFQGETGPYIQYIYVRTKSVLEKVGNIPESKDIQYALLTDQLSHAVLMKLYQFGDVIKQAAQKDEPSLISRYLIDLAQGYSSFYNENKIIIEDRDLQNARVMLTYMVGQVLKIGASLLGIKMPNKM